MRRQAPQKKNVFLEAHRDRRKDSQVLFKARQYTGAVYFGGFSIECLLKYAVCVIQNVRTLPDEYRTHDLVRLMHLAGLDQHRDVNIAFHLSRITEWDVAIRYYAKRYSRQEAEKFQESVEEIRKWINKHLPK